MLFNPTTEKVVDRISYSQVIEAQPQVDHRKWRMTMAEKIAEKVPMNLYGIKGIYLFGSTKEGNTREDSDIDLLVHVSHTQNNFEALNNWFEGWSLCLSEMNYFRTGCKTNGILDIHYITDNDIKNKTSYAVKVTALSDAAKLLRGTKPNLEKILKK